jgi:hypothetical protein
MTDINAGSVSVEVVPDARLFAEKLRARLGNLNVKVTADADTKDAEAQLDEVARTRTATVNADTRNAERGISNLTTAITLLGPAMVPVAAATAGLVASLSAPLAAAGGGVTLYGLLTGKTVADTEKLNKQINALDAKAVSLTDPKARKAVIAQRDALYKQLSSAQKQFLVEQNKMQGTFQRLGTRLGGVLLGPLTQGMKDLDDLLPRTAPLLTTTSGAVSTLLDAVDRSAKSGSLARFGGFIETWAGYSIVSFGRSLGNIASGIAGIVQASAPLSGSVLDGLERMTGSFAKWGQNAGNNNFQDFLGYVHKVGPQAGKTLLDIAGAFGAIAKDAAPIGGTVLKGLDAFANILHKIADSKAGPTLFASAAAFVALRKAMQVGTAIKDSSIVAKILGRGASGGLGGSVGTIAGKALGKGVVPVYVTNKGFGGPGGVPKGGDGIPEPVKVGGSVAAGLSVTAAFAALGAGAIYGGSRLLENKGGFSNEDYVRQYQQTHGGNLPDPNSTRGFRDFGNGRTNIPPQYQDPQLRAQVAARQARLAAQSIRAQAEVGSLLLGPTLQYGKVLASLPAQVRTDIVTPGAITSKHDVEELRKQYDLTPKQVKTILRLSGVREAQKQLRAYTQMIEALNGKIARTFIQQVVRHPIAGGGHVAAYRSGMAGGGTVPGVRFPYADKILMPVAPGEEIVPNNHRQADKWRPLLKAISSGGMAAGGTVGANRGGAMQQEIRGVLSIDRNGMAYLHGVARDAVNAGDARQQEAARTAALGALR